MVFLKSEQLWKARHEKPCQRFAKCLLAQEAYSGMMLVCKNNGRFPLVQTFQFEIRKVQVPNEAAFCFCKLYPAVGTNTNELISVS